jgi:hypothetical protein
MAGWLDGWMDVFENKMQPNRNISGDLFHVF